MRSLVSLLLVLVLLSATVAPLQGQAVIAPGGLPGVMTCVPQFVAGGGYRTFVKIQRLLPESRQVGVEWFTPSGAHTALRAIEREVDTYSFVVNLGLDEPALTTLESAPDPSVLKTGSLCFTEPVNVWGKKETSVSVTYLHTVAGKSGPVLASETLVPVAVKTRGTFYGAETLGVAIANPNDGQTTVWLTREGGEKAFVTLPPHGQIARWLYEFEWTGGNGKEFRRGDEEVKFTSPIPVSVMTFQYVLDPTDGLDKYIQSGVATPPKDR